MVDQTNEKDVEDFVNQRYLAILGRPADPGGLQLYAGLIEEGEITKEELDTIFRGSDEYRERLGVVRGNRDIAKTVKDAYTQILKRPVDIGGLTHYVKQIEEGVITEDDVVRILKESDEYTSMPKSKVAFCQGTYGERVGQTLRCLERVAPGVDCCIIIVDDTVTTEQVDYIKGIDPAKVKVVYKQWKDDFPAMRNAYLEEARKEGATFVCVSDPDELYCEPFVWDIKGIVEMGESEDVALFLINSHDVTIDEDGGEHEVNSSFFKNLMFKLCDEVRYDGVAAGFVHENLIICAGLVKTLPSQYYYQHLKRAIDVKERGARNVWISGGGNNAKDKNPHFAPLRAITNKLALKSWKDVRAYVRKGNVDKELLDWIESIKDVSGADYINETRDWFLWYSLLHPEELGGARSTPLPLSLNSHDELRAFVEQAYLSVIGRHAEEDSKEMYVKAIEEGKVKRDDLEGILKESKEFKERK